jgi:hypothetical protein
MSRTLDLNKEFEKNVNEAIPSFHHCVADNPTASWFCPFETLKGGKDSGIRLGIGIYVAPLIIWRSVWGFDPLLVLRSEDLRCNPQDTMASVFEHIGVRPWTLSPSSARTLVNERGNDRKFTPSVTSLISLKRFYRPFNRQLATLLNDPKFLWEDDPCGGH